MIYHLWSREKSDQLHFFSNLMSEFEFFISIFQRTREYGV